MTQRIAEHDIIERNGLGQDVVIVPAGQPIPEGVEVPKKSSAKKAKGKKDVDEG